MAKFKLSKTATMNEPAEADNEAGDAAVGLLEQEGNDEATETTEATEVEPEAVAEPAAEVADVGQGVVVEELPDFSDGPPIGSQVVGMPPVVPEPATPPATPNPILERLQEKLYAELDAETDWQRHVDEDTKAFTELAIEHKKADDHAKELKKSMQEALKNLQSTIDSGPQKPLPLLDRPSRDKVAVTLEAHLAASPAATATAETTATESEAWKAAAIGELNLGDSLTEKLIENGIATLGQLEALRADIAEHRAKWPKGIGEAKITKIEDAVIDWLTKHRDAGIFQAAETEEKTEGGERKTEEVVEESATENLGEPISVEIEKTVRYQGGELAEGELYDVERNSEGVLSAILPDGKGLVELDEGTYTVFKRRPVEPAAEATEEESSEPNDGPPDEPDPLDDL
jgi:uncharacterized phage infection (PIP) family protein YhgE